MKITYSEYTTTIVGTHRTDEPIPKEWWSRDRLDFFLLTGYWQSISGCLRMEYKRYLDNDCLMIESVPDDECAFVVTVKVSEGV